MHPAHNTFFTMIGLPMPLPREAAERTAQIFFEQFNTPALSISEVPLLTAYAAGVLNALVVDIGAASAALAGMRVVVVGCRENGDVDLDDLRAKIAERLVEAQSSMAMLTTFNEVDMHEVMALRSKYKDLFEKTHNGVRLGFMSFFVKAAVAALKKFPVLNASVDGNDIVYHGYQDIGVAVSSDRGLVVPVLRNAEHMSLAEIEGGINEFGKKAKAVLAAGMGVILCVGETEAQRDANER